MRRHWPFWLVPEIGGDGRCRSIVWCEDVRPCVLGSRTALPWLSQVIRRWTGKPHPASWKQSEFAWCVCQMCQSTQNDNQSEILGSHENDIEECCLRARKMFQIMSVKGRSRNTMCTACDWFSEGFKAWDAVCIYTQSYMHTEDGRSLWEQTLTLQKPHLIHDF